MEKRIILFTVIVMIVTEVGNTKQRIQAWEKGTARERTPKNVHILNKRHRKM